VPVVIFARRGHFFLKKSEGPGQLRVRGGEMSSEKARGPLKSPSGLVLGEEERALRDVFLWGAKTLKGSRRPSGFSLAHGGLLRDKMWGRLREIEEVRGRSRTNPGTIEEDVSGRKS